MKLLGVISGMGTRAGLFFINKLIDGLDVKKDQDFPEFFLHNNSRVPDRTRAILYDEASPLEELKRSIATMNRCNVEVIVSTCVTAYHFIEQIKHESNALILNPVELVRNKIEADHGSNQKIGLLCTSGTLHSKMFHRAFAGTGHELITMDPDQQEDIFMRAVYMDNGLKSVNISEEAYQLLDKAVQELIARGAEIIIGGCSEVQIGLRQGQVNAHYIDTMDVLAEATLHAIQS
ncbi:aspartate/glutamate racemase family protein [Chitinophaga sp. Hz27]|uniref:aspartate/glutamate racemase family protein n=1 Tax=Chitinophaga sp. Hz27 TaxID=3347169 RepID=UPI0035E18E91